MVIAIQLNEQKINLMRRKMSAKIIYYHHVKMSEEFFKILKQSQDQKPIKILFIVYRVMKSLLEKM